MTSSVEPATTRGDGVRTRGIETSRRLDEAWPRQASPPVPRADPQRRHGFVAATSIALRVSPSAGAAFAVATREHGNYAKPTATVTYCQ